jgi:hypothetical protein
VQCVITQKTEIKKPTAISAKLKLQPALSRHPQNLLPGSADARLAGNYDNRAIVDDEKLGHPRPLPRLQAFDDIEIIGHLLPDAA